MRKCEIKMVKAINAFMASNDRNMKPINCGGSTVVKRLGNDSSICVVLLHGNLIASFETQASYVCHGGYNTNTTASRLRVITQTFFDSNVRRRNHEWQYLIHEPIDEAPYMYDSKWVAGSMLHVWLGREHYDKQLSVPRTSVEVSVSYMTGDPVYVNRGAEGTLRAATHAYNLRLLVLFMAARHNDMTLPRRLERLAARNALQHISMEQ